MIEEDEMGSKEKNALPYSLLLDPETGRAAAYTNNHRLITPLASQALVEFALSHTSHKTHWDDSKHDPSGPWRPLPTWATADVLARCVLVWIKRGNEPDAYWQSIPPK